MSNPRTVYEILQLLEDCHASRLATYRQLVKDVYDATARILLEYLTKLEHHSLRAVRDEMQQLDPHRTTYMTSGPVLSHAVMDARECRCDTRSNIQDMVECALEADRLTDELLHRLEGSSAARSVRELAKRLRELKEIKGRQIAEFTRQD